MIDFVRVAAAQGLLAAIIFFFTSLAASYFLFNSSHGTLSEWQKLLEQLKAEIPSSRTRTQGQWLQILAPLDRKHCYEVQSFLDQHSIVDKVGRRLAAMRRKWLYVVIAMIFGLSIGMIVAGPMLIGAPPLTQDHPFLAGFVAACGTALFVIFCALPHVHWWNALKDAIS
jgi:hypothetical protein